jgi:hypothetical protein
MSEVGLRRWADAHVDKPVGIVPFAVDDIDVNPYLSQAQQLQIKQVNQRYAKVFEVTQGHLPLAADHPHVNLNFKLDWHHVAMPCPKWGHGASQVLAQWAREQLRIGLFTRSKSPSGSRPHIVRKPPHNAPKDIDITLCDLRVCGDYRRANEQLQKSLPTTPNGTDKLQKLPGYAFY